jgi:hypothetical protein
MSFDHAGVSSRTRAVRVTGLTDQGHETDLQSTTPAERLGMMWQLAVDAWVFKGESVAEQRLPRHIVRVLRRRR